MSSSRSAPTKAADDGERLLRLLVESQTEYAIFLLDVEGCVASWNPGAQRIKGYAAEEIIGSHLSRFYTAPDIEREHPQHELEVARRTGRFGEEGWRVRKDGTTFWASIVITALRDEDGQHVGYAKVTRDLTERRIAEDALRRSADELAAANARLDLAERTARRAAERQRARAAALESIGRAIVGRVELDGIVQTATDAATEVTRAAFGAFFYNVVDNRGDAYMLYTISGVAREEFSRFPMPRKTQIFAPTFDGDGVVRSDDITQDRRYGHNEPYLGMPAGHLPVRSYLAVPVLTEDGEVAGGMFFGSPEAGIFDAEAESAAVSIAASAAVAISNARLLESARRETRAREAALEERDRVAKVLQESLMPPELPEIAGLEVTARYHPGTELVGGDFYDVFALGDGRWGIAIGDVCGSGPEAASRTALIRHSIRTASMFDSGPGHVLEALNTALLRSGSDRFATAIFARIEPRRGSFGICLATAGHPPMLICRTDGSVEESGPGGPLLGVVDEIRMGQQEVRIGPGDVVVLYTDGLVEARRNGQLFGDARVREIVASHRDRPVDEIASELVAQAREHAVDPITDDIALLVLRVGALDAG